MPYYDYACRDCGHQLEMRQSFEDDPLTVCPNCQGDLRRVIAPVGIVFKGGGYYVTDTRKSGQGPGTASESTTDPSSTPSDAGDGASKAETKADTTSESKGGSDGKKADAPASSAAEGSAKNSGDAKGTDKASSD